VSWNNKEETILFVHFKSQGAQSVQRLSYGLFGTGYGRR